MKTIGKTKSGKPVYVAYALHQGKFSDWTVNDHHDAADLHRKAVRTDIKTNQAMHQDAAKWHDQDAQQILALVGKLGLGKKTSAHATRKSPAQLDKEIAEFMTDPKLGDPKWEREWSETLTEKHSKARMPTIADVERALLYVEREYTLADGDIDGEQLAEGLAFGRYAGDAEDKRRAKEMFSQLSAAKWLRLAERANYIARDQGEDPRYA